MTNSQSGQISSSLSAYIIGLRHVGFLVEDLSTAVAETCALYGVSEDSVRYEPPAGVETATRFAFIKVADAEFEFIEAIAEPFTSLLGNSEKGQGGINHLAWTVSDIDAAMAVLAEQGVRPGHVTPDGVMSFPSKKLVYLNPEDCGGLLVELVEER